MEMDILKREELYRKENEKLELRTKELLQEMENVKKIQDNLIKESQESKAELQNLKSNSFLINRTTNKHAELKQKSYGNLISAYEPVGPQNNVPKDVSEMGNKGMTHFFRAQIKALQTENEKLQNECKKKHEECKKLSTENQTLKEEKEKWFLQYSSTKNNSSKFEKQIASLNSKLQIKDNEVLSIKKDVDHLQKDLKAVTLKLNAAETRLNRAQDEALKAKSELKNAKQCEKDLQDNYRKQISDLEATVKTIDKHKNELLHSFKKQMQLIENLKEQKANLETMKLTEIAERDFMRILDWKPGMDLGNLFTNSVDKGSKI